MLFSQAFSVGMLHILFTYTFASFLHDVFWSFLPQATPARPHLTPNPCSTRRWYGWRKKILHQLFQIPLFTVLLYISQVLSRIFFHQSPLMTKSSQEHAERLVTFASSTPKLKERFGQRMKEFLCFASLTGLAFGLCWFEQIITASGEQHPKWWFTKRNPPNKSH